MGYICLHCHFYQPPRENPWLEAIELQDSAYPYHDWNERITAECYAPNVASRILGSEGRIEKIVNNYSKISFNFGPTLLAWMEAKAPDVYEAVLGADRESQKNFPGHGSALAQAYNHMILPLAKRRDKYTQVLWGIRDFEHRFGRKPEGMWLPETAVDLETLDILAELGIRFTILAPSQARRTRRMGSRAWRDVSGGRIDPTMPYELRLPSRRSINLFFYDGPISRAVAFEGLLNNGEVFAQRLLGAFSEERTWPEIVHIATDGETYGHHHKRGEMGLAYALEHIQSRDLAELTNYGEYLERHSPSYHAEIFENTSWSCAHGVERWRSDCGCNGGGQGSWNQSWRAPLREALDWLRDALAPCYETHAGRLLKDPWAARNDYIEVILDRSPESLARFWSKHAAREMAEAEKITALKLLELQRHAMLMYTSCGWFFSELSGIETVQVIQYAGRAVQLAQELFGDSIEARFLERLERAKSNIPEHQDGRRIYEKFVRPAMIDLAKVGAHYAVSSLFWSYPDEARVHCYRVDREDYQCFEAGRSKLVLGRAKITSDITGESAVESFAVIHFGDHNLQGGIREYQGEETYGRLVEEAKEAFGSGDIPAVLRLLDKYFQASTYSLRSLFRDEQRRILNQVLDSTLAEAEATYQQIYENHAPLMRFLTDIGIPLPKAFYMAAGFALNGQLRNAFSEEDLDLERIESLLEQARANHVDLDAATLEFTLRRSIERIAGRLLEDPSDLGTLETLEGIVSLVRTLPFEVSLWEAQNVCYELAQTVYPEILSRKDQDENAETWARHFTGLAEKLSVRVEQPEVRSQEPEVMNEESEVSSQESEVTMAA